MTSGSIELSSGLHNKIKAMFGEFNADVAVGCRNPSRVMLFSVGNDEVERDREHQPTSGSVGSALMRDAR